MQETKQSLNSMQVVTQTLKSIKIIVNDVEYNVMHDVEFGEWSIKIGDQTLIFKDDEMEKLTKMINLIVLDSKK
jgi:hypothetical protein